MIPDYFVGLDLGQPHEFTAIAVLERSTRGHEAQRREDWQYALRHLHRFPAGTPYTAIVPAVLELVNADVLNGPTLVVDQTGVGKAVVEMLSRANYAGSLVPVTITAGQDVVRQEDFSWLVPKKDLAAHVQVVLQERRLKIARTMPHADLLAKELQMFRVKVSLAQSDSVDAWREGAHDDLVLAVALACWWAERTWPWTADSFSGGGGIFANVPDGIFAFDDCPDWLNKQF